MSYEIYITRKSFWADNNTRKCIKKSEWHEYASKQASWMIRKENGEHFYEVGDSWFDLKDGSIYTKNPEQKELNIAHKIAFDLKAKIQGEEGEIYLITGEIVKDTVSEIKVYPQWLFYFFLTGLGFYIATLYSLFDK